ncbi:TetR/AcrR family transcriptional regulator [Vallitalea okinawensis]|uniref:TetR/AcrR family transcriptional regulator n=1 Tax=Vallitalea okinawensis TaxID=2078660 RepID=UPI00130065B6|nr:TetR/AcrR family transcriptional regulator [Vallitalea okinawensis]
MSYKTFEALPKPKKELILNVCIEEFAEYGYENASTNRIVKKINMSKGSLFKYFNTKEELYFYVLEHVVKSITSEMSQDMVELPKDIFDRVYKLAAIELNLYIKKPILYQLFKEAFNGKSEISQKLTEKYTVQAGSFFVNIFQDADFSQTKYDKEHVLKLLKWILIGYNEYFMEANSSHIGDIDQYKEDYLKELQMYMTMIKLGLDK